MYVYNGTGWDEVGFTVAHDVPAGGATGTLLSKASATDYDTSWLAQSALTIAPSQVTGTALVATTADAKGDLLVASAADTVGRLAVGANGAALVADSTATGGVSYTSRHLNITTSGSWFNPAYTATTTIFAEATVTMIPFHISTPISVDRIGCEWTVAGSAGAVVRLGLYKAQANGTTWDLVVDAGTVDATQAAGAYAINIDQSLTPGLYATAAVPQGGAGTRPTMRVGQVYHMGPLISHSTQPSGVAASTALRVLSVSGALSASVSPVTFTSASVVSLRIK